MATDPEMARELAEKHQPYVGAGGTLIPNVAIAVAAGIALGRREGLELAATLIAEEIARTAPKK
jgi:hypothetical protein